MEAAFERSRGYCECDARCSVRLVTGHIRYNHRIPCELGGDNSLENCQVLTDTCDKTVTRKDQANIGRARRVHAGHIGAKPRKHRKIPYRLFDGTPVYPK